jgi:hypothetical protein
MTNKIKDLREEIKSFHGLWTGGTSLTRQGFKAAAAARLRHGSDMHKIYEMCIAPYITSETEALDIGTNGGGWLKMMLGAKRLVGIDILTAEQSGFWRNMPRLGNIEYYQVEDFSCDCIEDNSLDHVFSYDVFCHISFSGATAYMKNLYSKMRPGTNCFIMIGDGDKYQDPRGKDKLAISAGFSSWEALVADYDGPPNKGRWYLYGIERFCAMVEEQGYRVINPDIIGAYDRNSPIVHFVRD